MKSLLSNIAAHIRLKPEDIFTEGLCYILSESRTARQDFCRFITQETRASSNEEIFFETQVSGESLDRPDLVGKNQMGQELMLGEVKFWSSLTENQPVTYLYRLMASKANSGKILFFICPELRVDMLVSEIKRRCDVAGLSFSEDTRTLHLSADTSASVFTFKEILSALEVSLAKNDQRLLAADLLQLQGLVHQIDEDSIKPLNTENFSPHIGRFVNQLYALTDEVAEKLISTGLASSENLRATPQYAGYSRYLRAEKIGIDLQLNFQWWYQLAETPFWLGLRKINPQGGRWEFSPEIKNELKDFEQQFPKKLFLRNEKILIPLYAPMFTEKDKIVLALSRQIGDILARLKHL
jgi:hypothetical protein